MKRGGFSLSVLARRRGVYFGCAVGRAFWTDAKYRELLAGQCGVIVAENVMKWAHIHPRRREYDWKAADELVAFARSKRMRMRGHTLVWHHQAPAWLEYETRNPDALIGALREHIYAVVTRYAGRIAEWDVVNEALDDGDGFYRDSFWYRALGAEYIAQALRCAHEADPKALLFYNDYTIEDGGPKTERMFELVDDLRRRGAPLHGVGLQCHFESGKVPLDGLRRTIARLAKRKLRVAITELDIRIARPLTSRQLARQAGEYAAVMKVFLSYPRVCQSFLTWGITDRYSWVPDFFKGYDDALPFDRDYRPKPAADALASCLAAVR